MFSIMDIPAILFVVILVLILLLFCVAWYVFFHKQKNQELEDLDESESFYNQPEKSGSNQILNTSDKLFTTTFKKVDQTLTK